MSKIALTDVSVDYPVYSTSGRSLKRALAQTIGGVVGVDAESRICVRALEAINLELKAGDRLAILGANGSGKSTLLKVLAGIYEPSSGVAVVEGRVSTLVDTLMGMDPEATGYENIIMRSIFLGASFKEARALVPEVGSFSELGAFLNFPMRTYSSGMVVRLAFAVSTAFLPEILVMDEQVAMADAGFTAKAQERILELIGHAKILVFATHNTEQAQQLCNRGIVLERGAIVFDGPVEEAVQLHAALLRADGHAAQR